jgi:hypothetical protein
LVNEKLADDVTPAAAAVTAYEPTTELAVAVTLTRPLASVVTVDAERVADAPEAGAVKVTAIPLIGLLNESVTRAWSGIAKGARTVADCGVPPVA